jgi:hypothetical protein
LVIIYLLQQRALEELNTFANTLAFTPRFCPKENASDTPIMLMAIAKLLHILATWKRRKLGLNLKFYLFAEFCLDVKYYHYSWTYRTIAGAPTVYRPFTHCKK